MSGGLAMALALGVITGAFVANWMRSKAGA